MSGERVMRIMIGGNEANFLLDKGNLPIANNTSLNTIVKIITNFRIALREVVIFSVKDFIVKSKIVLEQGLDIEEIEVRFSDALILAAMQKSPIFVDKKILEMFFFDAKDTPENAILPVQKMTLRELRTELSKAVAVEDYERAAEIRDEINIRTEQEDVK
jgi:bifunctional DNase/RNase